MNRWSDSVYFLEPSQLFSSILAKGLAPAEKEDTNIIKDLVNVFKAIEQSTENSDSEGDFSHLFDDVKLDSNKLGNTHQGDQ